MTIIRATDLTKSYLAGDREILVLDRVSLHVPRGQFLVVKGQSGSGKTTLLSLLSGLDRPSDGRVFIDGNDITFAPEKNLSILRNQKIGFVFQSFHLVPSLTALENVMFPAEINKDPAAREKASALLARVGMGHRAGNLPHQLSGGEKQRCAICRALINDPKILFADEPTGNLDSENGKLILDLLLSFQAERKATMILVTHSEQIAKRSHRMVTLHDGRLVSDTRISDAGISDAGVSDSRGQR